MTRCFQNISKKIKGQTNYHLMIRFCLRERYEIKDCRKYFIRHLPSYNSIVLWNILVHLITKRKDYENLKILDLILFMFPYFHVVCILNNSIAESFIFLYIAQIYWISHLIEGRLKNRFIFKFSLINLVIT